LKTKNVVHDVLLEIILLKKIMSSGSGSSSYMGGSISKLISCCTCMAMHGRPKKCKMAANRLKPQEYVILVKIIVCTKNLAT
jgi:hypothetical protein